MPPVRCPLRREISLWETAKCWVSQSALNPTQLNSVPGIDYHDTYWDHDNLDDNMDILKYALNWLRKE